MLASIIAALVLGVISLVHLYRIVYPFPVIIGSYDAPQWISWVAFILLGAISLWVFWSL